MGVSSLICVFYQGHFVVAQYAQFDGFPQGQGLKILKFLVVPGNITRLTEGLENIKYLSMEELDEIYIKVSTMNRNAYEKKAESDPDFPMPVNIFKHLYPSLSREVGGDILEMIAQSTPEKKIPHSLELEFANESFFCEWAYVVDLDNDVFEVFGGAESKETATNKRFNDVGQKNDTVPKFVESFAFDDLPQGEPEFIEDLLKITRTWCGN
ncbi:hypothetical protein PAAG_01146 [Paracoccidioides lutzii Pb01]|uniref:Uncharacterized protein n=1 Tax=Paracoccidioides lutzii (strain ATCC MYA-826 / Pb01) TaxID=502779 RepID=C1GRK1_PARBA|nr:hypothetical protein PAAG_01146 [Paracoccidioides lutzii Pb01]EEH38225.1 hypothetical protein PAAG_01146 [Paracoccidioides lutzii Pb01]